MRESEALKTPERDRERVVWVFGVCDGDTADVLMVFQCISVEQTSHITRSRALEVLQFAS